MDSIFSNQTTTQDLTKILIVDDTAFVQHQRQRSINNIREVLIPRLKSADIVIYMGKEGVKTLKGNVTLDMVLNDVK